MRKLYLVNEIGTTYFFDYRSSSLISSIGNLGVEKQNTYVAYSNRYTCVEIKNPQTSLDFGSPAPRGECEIAYICRYTYISPIFPLDIPLCRRANNCTFPPKRRPFRFSCGRRYNRIL